MNLKGMRIGFAPVSNDFSACADRRRFYFYAKKRGLKIEIARPDHQYDVVVLSQRADLSVWHKYPRNGKIICDFVDPYLSVSQSDLKGQLRGISKFITRQNRYPILNYWRGIERMSARADAVVCSTLEQMNQFKGFCNNVHLILDFHGNDIFCVKDNYSIGKTINLVWEGLAASGIPLEMLKNIIEPLKNRYKVALHLVTDLTYYKYHDKYFKCSTIEQVRKALRGWNGVYVYQWNSQMISRIATSCDLALIPIEMNEPFKMGKPENKLVFFWRMGIPTLTTATAAYSRVMNEVGLPMTCSEDIDWHKSIDRYIKDDKLREEAGKKGYAFALKEYSEEKTMKKWDELFSTLF